MSDTQRIRYLDVWRFIAVSMVIVSHLISESNFSFLATIVPGASRLVRFGNFGVLIFFFISGFVICRGLMEEGAGASVVSLKAFYVRRAFRILPPLWLYLATLAVLGAAGATNIAASQIGISALFLSNFVSEEFPWVLIHTWSLNYEEQFYLIFPLLFVRLGFTARPGILLVMLSLMVLVSVWLKVLGADWWAGYLGNMNFLLTGCAAALYWRRLSPICRCLSVRRWLMVVALLIACVGLLPRSMDIYVKAVLYPPLILLLCLGTPVWHLRVRAFFQNPLLAYLGKISYTVYLWQQLATAPYPTLSIWWTVLFVLCAWLFAHFSYQYFERPLIGMVTRWSDAIKQRAFFGRSAGFAK